MTKQEDEHQNALRRVRAAKVIAAIQLAKTRRKLAAELLELERSLHEISRKHGREEVS